MKQTTIDALEKQFEEFPRSRGIGASESEVQKAEIELGIRFPPDYREFLMRYGAAEVGPYPVYGLSKPACMGNVYSVVDVTKEFRAAGVDATDDWLIVAEDLAGNYIGIGRDSVVKVWDHDLGGTISLADSFEDFVRRECLRLKSDR